MDHVDQAQQNGHAKIYKEVEDNDAVTDHTDEQRTIEGDDSQTSKSADNELLSSESKVMVLQDDEDATVYQQHDVLPDGREMITTTTITVDENGEATEETVTEIVESEEVEVSDEEEAELSEQEAESSKQEADPSEQEAEQSEQEAPEKPQTEEVEKPEPEEEEEGEEEETAPEVETKAEPELETKAEPEEAVEISPEQDEVTELGSPQLSEDSADQPGRSMRRHLSYEEFAEQYTEYKPPKRYEKKQTDRAADKAAPKIRIMGLPSNDFHSAPPSGSDTMSHRTSISSQGDDSMSEKANVNQPTKTQGSVMRRMDQGSNVDPANVVRAEDKPDLEAELPSSGMSRSLKSKFQSMEGEQSTPVDFSQPVKRERPRTGQFGYTAAPVVNSPTEGSDSNHHVPEFEGGEIENCPVVRDDVVREADRNDEVELPESGKAKSLLSRWSQMETESSQRQEYKPSGIGSKPTVTPLRPTSHGEVVNTEKHVVPEVEGGEYENTPVERTDVIKESDTAALEEELPTVGLAKDLMSKFRQKEEDAKKVHSYKPSGAGNRAPRVRSRPTSACSSEPHVEPQFEEGEVENTPVVRPDVVRESDRTDDQELPEVGYAKNLKARLKELREQQHPADYIAHTPSGVGSKATPTPIKLGGTNSLSINNLDSAEGEERVEPQADSGEYENQPVKRTDVIREEDRTDGEELPEAGIAKSLMSQFKTLESQTAPAYTPSGVGSKATPSKLHIMAGKSAYSAKGYAPEPVNSNGVDEEHPVEAGEYENTPTVRDDVVRADSTNNYREMPEEGVTKNIMSRFKSIEDENKSTVQHRPSKIASKPTPTPLRPKSGTAVSDSAVASEASTPDQVEVEGGEYENTPEINHNITRSSDPNEHEYIPSAGAAKSLMNKFRQLETQESDRVKHKPSKVAGSLTPTPLQLKR